MNSTKRWYLVALLVLALPLIVPFLPGGIPTTADAEIHMHRMVSAATDLENGYLWPRWTPYLHQGYGYPIHNFYAPGIHIVGALIYLLTHLDPVIVLKLLQFGITLLYPIGAYLFVRSFTGRAGALVAATAYLYAPFRFQELWIQSNLSQFCAMALLPWVLWAITRGGQRPSRGWGLATGVFFALIVVSHHPTAFLFAPFAGLYALLTGFMQPRRQIFPALLTTVGGLAFGLALSAIFWLPALLELRYTQIDALQTGMFSIGDNVVPLRDLLSPTVPVDRSLWAIPPQLQIGLPQWIAALLGLASLRLRGERPLKWHVLAGGGAALLCAWMITPASIPLWNRLPIANLVVYPWRLLGVIGVAVLPGVAALPALFPTRWRSVVAGTLISLFFAATVPMLYAPLTFRPAYAPTVRGETLFEQRTGDVGLTSADDYLPRWASQRPLAPTRHETDDRQWQVFLDALPPGATAQPEACSRGISCYAVSASDAAVLTVHQMYFPGWQATVNGQPVDLQPTGPFGLIALPVPAGESHVRLWYGGTPVQHIAGAISLAACLVVLISLILSLRRPRIALPVTDVPDVGTGLPKYVGVAMIAFLILNQAVLSPHRDSFLPHSDPSAPPASHPQHIVFGDTLELAGYDLDTGSASPGETIRVRLYWHLLKATDLELRGAVQITSLDGRQMWGGHNSINLGGFESSTLTPDYYVTDLYPVRIANDAPPYVGHISIAVFWLDNATIRYLLTDQGKTTGTLTDFRITRSNPPERPSLIRANLTLGDAVALVGYESRADSASGKQCLTLRWQALRDNLADYAVMIHVLAADGTMLTAADGPPLEGLYPTFFWRGGQILDDEHCFEVPAGAVSAAVGLYTRQDGTRLPMLSSSGEHQSDDALVVKL
ncbi:MAG TPA: 6-pyruvoyl-tetrahydropterin synthase-related protein, partial [Aggregatilineales bacterium]|nr:6-pyruvoyl-tetrahydropterin synthase-related protein [Aggregatilineales bacterium]